MTFPAVAHRRNSDASHHAHDKEFRDGPALNVPVNVGEEKWALASLLLRVGELDMLVNALGAKVLYWDLTSILAALSGPDPKAPGFAGGYLLLAAVLALSPYEASKECKGGAFNAGFGPAFDAQRCDIVLKFGGAGREIRIPLRDILQLCCPPKQACTSRRTLMGVGC